MAASASRSARCPPTSSSVAVERPSPTSSIRSAHHGDDDVGLTGGGDGLGDHLVVGLDGHDDLRPRLPVGEERSRGVVFEGEDLGACGVRERPVVGEERAQAVEHGRDLAARLTGVEPVDLPRRAGPVAELRLRVVGERADQRDPAGRGGGALERQRAVVAQEDERAARYLEVQCRVGGRGHHLGDAGAVGHARVLEQPEVELERQDAGDGAVEVGLVEDASGDGVERAAAILAVMDGLQVQWLLDPTAFELGRASEVAIEAIAAAVLDPRPSVLEGP